MNFGEKVRSSRNNIGLTQKELAKVLGVSVRTITSYERENRIPRKIEIYNKLAEVLKVDIDYLMGIEKFEVNADIKETRRAKELVKDVIQLFAEGGISDETIDQMMKEIQEAYWIGKEKRHAK